MSEPLSPPLSQTLPTPLPAGAAPAYAPPTPPSAAAYGAPPVREDEYDRQTPLSPMQRVVDTFVAPSKTFADIRRNRSWWLPFVLLAVLGYVFAFAVEQRVGMHNVAQNMMRSNPAQAEKLANAPPEQRAAAMKMTETFTKIGMYTGPVLVLVFEALFALLLWAGFNFILGGSSTYPGMFAVAMFAALPSLLHTLLTIVTIYLGDAETFNLQNPAGTNPGYFLGAESPAVLRSLLTSLDVFTIWQVLLLGLGGAIVARVKPSKGIVMVAAVWLVIVLARVGFAAATS